MKTITLVLSLIFLITAQAQTTPEGGQAVYDVQPGMKSNQIKLTVSNVSETNAAENVNITLLKKSSSVNFKNEAETVELIEPNKEKVVTFTFDVNRNAPVNKKDTIEFMITDLAFRQAGINGTLLTKTFIINYTPPKEFKLEQNFPNPFNPTTTIQYQISASPNPSKGGALVSLKVYDILGSEVETLVNEEKVPGYYEVQFNGSNYASGMYIYRLQAGNFVSTKKMLMVK